MGDEISIRSRLTSVLIAVGAIVTLARPAEADSERGSWLSPSGSNWPLVAIHAVLTPDGRVLTYGTKTDGRQTGYFNYDVWDPNDGLSGGHLTLPNLTATDLFCSAQIILPGNGDIFLAGGDNWTGTSTTNTGNSRTSLYRYDGNALTRGNDMFWPRWYATTTVLMNGEILIQGGRGLSTTLGDAPNPEVRQLDGSFRLLSGANTSGFYWYYPRNFVAPNGRVFGYDALGKMYYLTTSGVGSVTLAGTIPLGYMGVSSSAAMFLPGKILQFGGNSADAIVIDINGSNPVITQTQSLSSQRQWVNATLLPDGRVLATGGSEVDNALINVNNSAEIWNPATGQWTVGRSGVKPRLYHSIALLLPDASVLVAGGGALQNSPGPVLNLNAEIYYPPYLYNTSGGFASRPVIGSAPDTLTSGQTFDVGVGAAAIGRVTLVKTGAVTHSLNMDQRFVELPFTASNGTLSVQIPQRATDTPPGYYLLFVIDDNGVPSKGKIVRINTPSDGGGGTTTRVVRVNAGGGAFTDSLGQSWAADSGFNTGAPRAYATAVANTVDDALYQTGRFDKPEAPELMYSFNVPSGTYLVRLHFAENYSGTYAVGKRVFDVDIEGVQRFADVDIFKEAGAATALVKSTTVSVADGQINILFRHQVENPIVNAIEIIGQGVASDTSPPSVPSGVNAIALSTTQVSLAWNASTDAGSGVGGYRVLRDGAAVATTTATNYTDTGLTPNTLYTYTVVAFDKATPANESAPSPPDSATTLSGTGMAIRVNAGGGAFTDSLGQSWAADSGFNTGAPRAYATAVANTVDDALYQTGRFDKPEAPELMYSFNVPSGTYLVRLHFAENYSGTYAVGKRVFDVDIEGVQRFADVDIFKEAGAATALVKSTTVSVADGQINILFRHQVENPIVNAIEIIAQ